ncbi:DUF6262 family protein [Rhodococcoides yunnanense]|uniref:DUF6262 family protein n=1 Tax=Rhodococcoides yunnanense TaxID=278209 RepID=UPI0009350F6C|nr:DUF6262 family protein [Rhodococcus yunnanensis]
MPDATPPTAVADGRRSDSMRRRERVMKALRAETAAGAEISVSAIARAAGVDRSFLYRHVDLLAQIHAAQLEPPPTSVDGAVPVTRQSLKADVANARHTIARMTAHTGRLERRLSELLGEQAWRESGLGAPLDIDQLQRRVDELEQYVGSLKDALAERDAELHAARGANRELFGQINR